MGGKLKKKNHNMWTEVSHFWEQYLKIFRTSLICIFSLMGCKLGYFP